MGGSYYSTLSMAIPVLYAVNDVLESFEDNIRDEFSVVIRLYIVKLKKVLDKRFSKMKSDNLYIKAMVLDPEFRFISMNETETNKIMDEISSEINSFVVLSNQNVALTSTQSTVM